MRFEDVFGRYRVGRLSCEEAADVLGVSVSSFFRWRRRYEAEGAAGLADARLGRASARRAPVDEVARVLELFETRYWDFTAKHFHEKLASAGEASFALSTPSRGAPAGRRIHCRRPAWSGGPSAAARTVASASASR
jgi:transposase-like protein